jgi:hypothetical protein
MLGTTEKSIYFTKLKAGGRFAIYAFGIYLADTSNTDNFISISSYNVDFKPFT